MERSPAELPDAVRELHETMHRRRVGRLKELGFDTDTAVAISELHTQLHVAPTMGG